MDIKYKYLPKHKKILIQMNRKMYRYCYEVRYVIEVDHEERIVEGFNILKIEKLNKEELENEVLELFKSNYKRDRYRIYKLISIEPINSYYIRPTLME